MKQGPESSYQFLARWWPSGAAGSARLGCCAGWATGLSCFNPRGTELILNHGKTPIQ